MKVTKKILSIPPYVSTAWKHVSALRLENGDTLIVELFNGTRVEIPGLEGDALKQIFAAHETYLEEEMREEESEESAIAQLMNEAQQLGDEVIGLPLRFGSGGFEGMGNAMQHDPSQAEAPDLPPEILEKIAGISQVLGAENTTTLPQPHPGCNCFHCQIAKAIGQGNGEQPILIEEEVTAEDLKFREWDIEEMGDHLYQVTNPLDNVEQYKVCLKPVGCNCGKEGCEHVKAVLKT